MHVEIIIALLLLTRQCYYRAYQVNAVHRMNASGLYSDINNVF